MRPAEPAWLHPLDALLQAFAVVGVGAAAALALLALVLRIVDGSWERTLAVVESVPDGEELRWIGRDGRAHAAAVTPHERRILAGADSAEIFTNVADPGRMRMRRTTAAVRFTLRFAGGMAILALVSTAASVVLLFVRG